MTWKVLKGRKALTQQLETFERFALNMYTINEKPRIPVVFNSALKHKGSYEE